MVDVFAVVVVVVDVVVVVVVVVCLFFCFTKIGNNPDRSLMKYALC